MNKTTEELILNVYNLIKEFDDNDSNKETIIKALENGSINDFVEFYYDISAAKYSYLYTYNNDEKQQEISNKFKEVCKWIISNKEVFDNFEDYDYIPDFLISEIGINNEGHHHFKLMKESNIEDYYAEQNHKKFRLEIMDILKNKKELSDYEKSYLDSYDRYMKSYFGHSLTILEDRFFDLPDEVIKEFFDELDNSDYLDKIIENCKSNKMSFEDSNLLYQYSRVALKIKDIYEPEKLKDDKLIRGIYDGTITNPKIIEMVFPAKDIDVDNKRYGRDLGTTFDYLWVFKKLLEEDGKDTSHLYLELAKHLKSVGLEDKSINNILIEMIKTDEYHSVVLVDDLKVQDSENYNKYVNNRDYDERRKGEQKVFECSASLFALLKEREQGVKYGEIYNIPFDYVCKNINDLSRCSIENVFNLINDGYYSEEETEKLKALMQEEGIVSLYKEYTYDEAKEIIKDVLDNKKTVDEFTINSCVSAIVKEKLKENGIEYNKSYFGTNKRLNGCFSYDEKLKYLWFNNDLVQGFLYSDNIDRKTALFETVFHEMQHAMQYDNMEKGKIDYLGYCFIKEEIIQGEDEYFYHANYKKMFIEEDARQFGIINALKFYKELGIKDFDKIYDYYKGKLGKEFDESNITEDSNKYTSFRTEKKVKIDEYVSKLIRNNPKLLEEYNGILKIEFNKDGSKKSIDEVLADFNSIETKEEQDSKFSIYYGIVNKLYEESDKEKIDEDQKKKIETFFERKDNLIEEQDMRFYYQKSNSELNKKVLSCFEKEIKGINKKEEKRENGKIVEIVESKKSDNKKIKEEDDGRI